MTTPADEDPLVVDADAEVGGNAIDDGDSALNVDAGSVTASITSSILQYRQENGRTYHAYKDGQYVLPNDEPENERLDLQHHLFTLTFDGKLCTCPAGQDKQLHRVLDAGTGTGIWALDFADEHPETAASVDELLFDVPPNLSFFVDDLEENWTYETKFDFIYGRMLTGSLSNWPKFFKQCFEYLNPGGWVEVADILFPLESEDGTVTQDTAIKKWADKSLEASQILKRPLDSALYYKEQLAAAGFTNIVVTKYKWPQNSWPKDKRYKEMGTWCLHNLCDGISGLSLALYTRGLKWTAEELELFLIDVRRDFRDRSIHGIWPIYVAYAQKPQ